MVGVTLFVRRYGASPLHLAAHLAALALAGWALLQVMDIRAASNWALWFLGAALLHDLLFVPAYSLLDRALRLGRATSVANVVRIPAFISGVLLLVSFPRVLDRQPGNYERVAGYAPTGYLEAWLLITAGLFAASLAWWVVRRPGAAGAGDHHAAR